MHFPQKSRLSFRSYLSRNLTKKKVLGFFYKSFAIFFMGKITVLTELIYKVQGVFAKLCLRVKIRHVNLLRIIHARMELETDHHHQPLLQLCMPPSVGGFWQETFLHVNSKLSLACLAKLELGRSMSNCSVTNQVYRK